MTPCPERELALLAYYDGELDDAAAEEMDAHLASCAGCRAELERLDALSAALRRGLVGAGAVGDEARSASAGDAAAHASAGDASAHASAGAAPDTLRAAVREALRGNPGREPVARSLTGKPAPRGRPLWRGAAAAAVILLATLGGYVVGAERARGLAAQAAAQELLASHLRALLPGRLLDVASSDRHQVKPWFAGRLDFAPPVPELASSGFPLVGGRVDFFAGERAAAIVYMRRRHVIDVYILPARPDFTPPAAEREGFSLVSWREGSLQLVAISDVERGDLELFARLHAEAANPRIAPTAGS